jgi:hypothetical protein
MKRAELIAVLGLALLGPCWAKAEPVKAAPAEHKQSYVGQIFIVGNTVTSQSVILRQVQLFPGQSLNDKDIKASEQALRRLNLFENNPKTGVRPTIKILEEPKSDNPYKDILVEVRETRNSNGYGCRLLTGLEDLLLGTSLAETVEWIAENRGRNATLCFALLMVEETLNALGPALGCVAWMVESLF